MALSPTIEAGYWAHPDTQERFNPLGVICLPCVETVGPWEGEIDFPTLNFIHIWHWAWQRMWLVLHGRETIWLRPKLAQVLYSMTKAGPPHARTPRHLSLLWAQCSCIYLHMRHLHLEAQSQIPQTQNSLANTEDISTPPFPNSQSDYSLRTPWSSHSILQSKITEFQLELSSFSPSCVINLIASPSSS